MEYRIKNYFGQLRIYSLVDLILLLVVAGATGRTLWGAVLLHVGFLTYLEWSHKHEGRARVRKEWVWMIWLIGLFVFGQATGILYIFFSVIYAWKKQGGWGLASPFVRGLQQIALLSPMLSYHNQLVWLVGAAMAMRNLFGDMRDVETDKQQVMLTWPVILGFRRDWVFLHLIGVVSTTWLWWGLSGWPTRTAVVPFILNVIEVSSYWLTPRASNKKAAEELQKILCYIRRWGGQ